jgi:2-polyprenyl-6-hydroxyphenyl methylase/3-demethylubiquinone-9 3-methyltransferase
MMTAGMNVHAAEIAKFGEKAHDWWNPRGELKTLHAVNPLRIDFIREQAALAGSIVVDVGCGGGILTEGLADAGAEALGIDLSEQVLDAARQHAQSRGLAVNYRGISAEALAREQPGRFDVVTCMEMLEHVPDPASIVRSCAQLVRPGGKVFFSTLNKKLKSYLLAIVAAEYVLRMIPRGTHQFDTFIRPSELCNYARAAGLSLLDLRGVSYHPLWDKFELGDDLDVNYLAAFERPLG